ncbi:MAG: hypothetical protein R6U44_04070 [Archaeoglobaceae archaeon]
MQQEQEVKQPEAQTKKSSFKCACGNSVYFWRCSGKLKCQICGNFVDFMI